MTSRFIRSYLAPFAAPLLGAFVSFGLGACDSAVPQVKGQHFVIPDRSPSRTMQALDAPSTADAASGGSGDGSGQQAYCNGGTAGSQVNNPDGSFDNMWNCAPGGGISTIENVGTSDANGDGSYDQITTFEDGSQGVWHFTFDTSADFLVQTYHGQSDDGSETYDGTYTYVADDTTHSQMHEVWNLHDGTYVIDGLVGTTTETASSFSGTESFDDPSTEVSPDWSLDEVTNPDGTFSQSVHFNGEGFSSDYTYAVALDGHADYGFSTDLTDTQASPDYTGSYVYAADGSGEGGYRELFDDGSTDDVHDVIAADGSVVESWKFDDIATEQSVDQEGSMSWGLDGSGTGTVTTHVVGGGDQTCDITITADGTQTVDNCH